MPPLTVNSVSDVDVFRKQFTSARENDLAVEHGETVIGQSCLAVGIYGREHRVLAALSICTPTETMHARHEEFARIARRAARTLSTRIVKNASATARPDAYCGDSGHVDEAGIVVMRADQANTDVRAASYGTVDISRSDARATTGKMRVMCRPDPRDSRNVLSRGCLTGVTCDEMPCACRHLSYTATTRGSHSVGPNGTSDRRGLGELTSDLLSVADQYFWEDADTVMFQFDSGKPRFTPKR